MNKKTGIVVLITVLVTLLVVGAGIGIFVSLNKKDTETAKPTQNNLYVVAEEFADSENYEDAIKILDKMSTSEKNTQKYTKAYNKYKEKYVSQVLKSVKKLKAKNKYYKAIKKINTATALIGSNEILNQELKALSKKPKTKKKVVVKKEDGSNSDTDSANKPFYGIWCQGSKSASEAAESAKELAANGFDAKVFVTTDWSNLNKEKWYVVTAGVYDTKEDAENSLDSVKDLYSDAYVKYSGNYLK